MTTYKITFYPGMVLARPYYISLDKPTTDYGAIMDILADSLVEEGYNGLFDDDEEYNDDEILICGNEGRRLITGGQLLIEEVTSFDIKCILQEKAGTDNIFGTVNIGFNDNDETQLCCVNTDDLVDLWIDFCNENDLAVTQIEYVEILNYRIQINTERGFIFVVGEASASVATDAGFYYSFTSNYLNADLYSRCLDNEGKRREFCIVREDY